MDASNVPDERRRVSKRKPGPINFLSLSLTKRACKWVKFSFLISDPSSPLPPSPNRQTVHLSLSALCVVRQRSRSISILPYTLIIVQRMRDNITASAESILCRYRSSETAINGISWEISDGCAGKRKTESSSRKCKRQTVSLTNYASDKMKPLLDCTSVPTFICTLVSIYIPLRRTLKLAPSAFSMSIFSPRPLCANLKKKNVLQK